MTDISSVEIEAVVIGKETTQTVVEQAGEDFATPDDALVPPLPLAALAALTTTSSVRRQIIEAVARNTVGLGWSLVAGDADEAPSDDELRGAVRDGRKRLDALAQRDVRLDGPSFSELLVAVKWDEEEVGQGFLEISRDQRSGEIDGLYHAPGKRMRRLKDRTGYVLVPPDGDIARGVRYLNYGSKVRTGPDGRPSNTLARGASWRLNEVLPFKLYSSENRDYGMPRDAHLMVDYLADKLAAQSNVSFFDSSGVPPTILFIQGEERRDGSTVTFKVPAETALRIGNTLRSDAGHQHKVAVIPVPPGTGVKDVRLAERSDRDMGFTEFRADNLQRALSAFRLQPIFVGASDSGRYDAEVQRAITLEQVFDPEQDRYEGRLQRLLDELGLGQLALKLKRLAVESDAARREAAERSAEVGAITYGEFRDAHGLPRFSGALEELNEQRIEVGKPEGAENRVNDDQDQRGLRPGIGGRVSRDRAAGRPSRRVEARVTELSGRMRQVGGNTQRPDNGRRPAA